MITVFTGKKFSVEVGPVRFPNGQEHVQEIVRHSACVVLIPIALLALVYASVALDVPIGMAAHELELGLDLVSLARLRVADPEPVDLPNEIAGNSGVHHAWRVRIQSDLTTQLQEVGRCGVERQQRQE